MTTTAALLTRARLTQSEAARLLGTRTQAVERWCRDPLLDSARTIPEPCRRLLALIADVPGVTDYLAKNFVEPQENA